MATSARAWLVVALAVAAGAFALALPAPASAASFDWATCLEANPGVSGPYINAGQDEWCKGEAERRFTADCADPADDPTGWCEWYGKVRAGEPAPPPVQPTAPDPNASPDPDAEPPSEGDPDPAGTLFGQSPICDELASSENCSRSGVVSRPYPLSHYGIDNWIDLGGWKPNLGNFIPSAIQSVSALVWQGLLWALNGALLLLEWAFDLKLTENAMPDLRRALLDLHEHIMGSEWTLFAIGVAGLWGIYNGLIRLRTIETIGALATTVLLMVAALVVIHDPDATVGKFSRMANDSALSVMSIGSTGSLDNPEQAFAESSERLFNVLVLNPWCALEFGSVDFCYWNHAGGDTKVKDAFLQHPAWSDERKKLYNSYSNGPQKNYMRLQGKDGAYARVGLLALMVVGMTGAVCLLLYLAINLVIASVMALGLTLAAPVLLLAPAFGPAGRKMFGTWAKRLAGAIIAKLVYALFLALVVFLANIIASMDGIGWGGRWLILITFWWGIFINRKQLVGFVTGGDGARGGGGGIGLLKAYLGMRAIKDVGGAAVRGATFLPRQAARGGAFATVGAARWGLGKRHDHRSARDQVGRDSMKEDLRDQAGASAHANRTKAKDILRRDTEHRKWRVKGKGPKPAGKEPTHDETQWARTMVSRHGLEGEISITDSDIERYVRESGDSSLVDRYETMQRPGLSRRQIKQEARQTPGFKRNVTRERKRYRREQRTKQKRDRVYRRR